MGRAASRVLPQPAFQVVGPCQGDPLSPDPDPCSSASEQRTAATSADPFVPLAAFSYTRLPDPFALPLIDFSHALSPRGRPGNQTDVIPQCFSHCRVSSFEPDDETFSRQPIARPGAYLNVGASQNSGSLATTTLAKCVRMRSSSAHHRPQLDSPGVRTWLGAVPFHAAWLVQVFGR